VELADVRTYLPSGEKVARLVHPDDVAEPTDRLSRFGIPESRVVIASSQDIPAIRRICCLVDGIRIANELMNFLSGPDVPLPYRCIPNTNNKVTMSAVPICLKNNG